MKYAWDLIDGKPLIETEQWMLASLMDKGVPLKYTKKPAKEIVIQLEMIFKFLFGSRNFILIVSNRTAYVSALFYYISSTWLVNTSRNFEIIDLTKIKEDDTLLYRMEYANLLMIPYNNSDNYQLRNVRNSLGAILIKRQVKNIPTIIELYVKQPPGKMQQKELLGLIKNLSSLYGDAAASTFMDKESNIKILTVG